MFEGTSSTDTNPCFLSKVLRTFLPSMAKTISKPNSTLLISFAIFFFSTYDNDDDDIKGQIFVLTRRLLEAWQVHFECEGC